MSIVPTGDLSEITSRSVLLIEGNDEINFFNSLLSHMGVMQGVVQTRSVKGKDNFQYELPAFLNDPNFSLVTAYAIIRDADDDETAALQSIKALLQEYQQPCPRCHADFAFNDDRTLKVGVFVIPGNAPGMLEDMCLQSVATHPIMPHVNDFIVNVDNTMGDQAPKNKSKAKVQAFLSGMHHTVPNLGVAALKNYWRFDDEVFNDLRHFIRQLIIP